jgi:hypothetical protein
MATRKKSQSRRPSEPANDQPLWAAEIELMERQLKAPNALLLALETRAPWEFGATLAAWPLLKNAPEGDGHPVIVFPGLGAGDLSTAPLRNFLSGKVMTPTVGIWGAILGRVRACYKRAWSVLVKSSSRPDETSR